MESLISYIVNSLVDEPDEVKLQTIEGESGTVIELRVASKDLGKVIGKNGRIAKSLRTILSAAGNKDGTNFNLEIVD